MPFETFLQMHGEEVTLERDGEHRQVLTALFNIENATSRKYCGFPPGTDIKPNDWIIKAETKERFFVTDTVSQSFHGRTVEIKAFYKTAQEYEYSLSSQSPVFHIQNAYGSVIGIGNTATINYQNSVEEIRKAVESTESPDKEQLKQIVTLLEMVVNNQVPASKGLFSKFSRVMEQNSWIAGSVASTLMSWLLSQIP